ncbi:MAG TPA: DUF6790 family protein [Terracidiphilus sp.]|nr:DUF6790 family protein [Terracidiphilus sp.]
MYLVVVLLLMLVLPVGSAAAELLRSPNGISWLAATGKWFVFYTAGIRLLTAGIRQFIQPGFTARQIFHMESDDALPIIRELGVANFATGLAGVLSLWRPSFTLPVALIAAVFYGIAGVRHIVEKGKSFNENIAMVTDLFAAAVFLVYVVGVWIE